MPGILPSQNLRIRAHNSRKICVAALEVAMTPPRPLRLMELIGGGEDVIRQAQSSLSEGRVCYFL
jgi:hypothetical protein